MTTVHPNSIVVAVPDQVSTSVEDETIVLGLDRGAYFGLEGVGQRIWSLIESPAAVSEIRDTIADEYDVDPDVCERDLFAFLRDLEQAGLIRIVDASQG